MGAAGGAGRGGEESRVASLVRVTERQRESRPEVVHPQQHEVDVVFEDAVRDGTALVALDAPATAPPRNGGEVGVARPPPGIVMANALTDATGARPTGTSSPTGGE